MMDEEAMPSGGGSNSSLSSGGFGGAMPQDRTASGLQYQKYQMGLTARGAALGLGRRVAPDPSQMFSNPPMSGGQFGGGHAKSMVNFGGDQEQEDE